MNNPELGKKSSSSTRDGRSENEEPAQGRRKPDAELASTLVTNLSQLLAEQAERDEQRNQQEPGENQTLVTNLSQVLAERAEHHRDTQRNEQSAEPPQNTTERAGEPFPHQLTSSAGWETAPAPTTSVRRSRPLLVVFGLVLVATLGGAAVFFRNARPEASSHLPAAANLEAPAVKILDEIERDLQARRWTEVVSKSSKLLGAPDVSSADQDAARAKQARASQEASTQQVYERFLAAVASGRHDEALALYREIPDGSVYQPMAKEPYERTVPLFIGSHLKAIEAAGEQASCDALRIHIEAILRIVPDHAETLAVRERRCPVQAPERESARVLPESGQPVEEAPSAERAGDRGEAPGP